jgi:adenylate cyclase
MSQIFVYVGQWPATDAVLAQMLEKLKASINPEQLVLTSIEICQCKPGTQALENVFKSTPNLIGIEKKVADSRSDAVAPPRC